MGDILAQYFSTCWTSIQCSSKVYVWPPVWVILLCSWERHLLTFSVLGNNLGMDWYLIQVKGKVCTQPIGAPSHSLSPFQCSMKWVLLLPPGWNAIPWQGYPPAFHQASLTIPQYPFILLGWERHGESQLFFPRAHWPDQVLYPDLLIRSPVHWVSGQCISQGWEVRLLHALKPRKAVAAWPTWLELRLYHFHF